MDSRSGKNIRRGRLFNQETGKCLIVAYSHGLLMGPRQGLATLAQVRDVAHQVRAADGLMVSPGMLPYVEDAFVGRDRPSLVIHLDYQSFSRGTLPYAQGAVVEMASIEDVVAAGGEVVMTYLYMGYDDPQIEKLEIERNARIARACERWGVLLMIEPRSAREATHPEDKTDPEVMAMYCRISAEVGADIVKCIYPGSVEAFAQIVEGCPCPVLAAGGARAKTRELAYQRARDMMAAGASGLVFGRNIYENPEPGLELARYREIVHGTA